MGDISLDSNHLSHIISLHDFRYEVELVTLRSHQSRVEVNTASVQDELLQVRQGKHQWKRQIHSAHARIRELEARKESLALEIVEAEYELSATSGEVDKTAAEFSSAVVSHRELQVTAIQLADDHSDVSAVLLQATEEKMAHGVLIDALRRKVGDLQRRHSVVRNTNTDIVDGAAEIQRQLDRLRAEKVQLEEELGALQRSRSEADGQRRQVQHHELQHRQKLAQRLKVAKQEPK